MLSDDATDDSIDTRYPWIAMGVVLTGTFMVILDTTIVNVALPDIGRDLDASGGIEWVVTGYLLAVAVSQLLTGWVSDRFGKKNTFIVSLVLFSAGSLLCALAPNLIGLVGFRVIQGLGGGAMMPVGLAMVYELFPPRRRGTALGIWGIAAMAAPALGPVLGGWFATSGSWRWVFAVNVPIGTLGVLLARRLLRDIGYRETRRLDISSLVLAATSLSLLLVALDRTSSWGWSSGLFWILAIVGLVGIVGFAVNELRSDSPLLELRMFAVPTFSITIGIVWLITTAQFARLVVMPIELQVVHDLTPLRAGLMLAPAALGTALTMPIGGRIADRIGPKVPVLAGLVIVSGALWALSHLTPSTSTTAIVVILAVQGTGFGLAVMPNTVAAMNALPARFTSRAAAVRSLNRQVGGSIAVAVHASVIAAQIGTLTGDPDVGPSQAQGAYNDAFLIAFGATIVAIVLSLWLPGRAATRQLLNERAAEYIGVEPT